MRKQNRPAESAPRVACWSQERLPASPPHLGRSSVTAQSAQASAVRVLVGSGEHLGSSPEDELADRCVGQGFRPPSAAALPTLLATSAGVGRRAAALQLRAPRRPPPRGGRQPRGQRRTTRAAATGVAPRSVIARPSRSRRARCVGVGRPTTAANSARAAPTGRSGRPARRRRRPRRAPRAASVCRASSVGHRPPSPGAPGRAASCWATPADMRPAAGPGRRSRRATDQSASRRWACCSRGAQPQVAASAGGPRASRRIAGRRHLVAEGLDGARVQVGQRPRRRRAARHGLATAPRARPASPRSASTSSTSAASGSVRGAAAPAAERRSRTAGRRPAASAAAARRRRGEVASAPPRAARRVAAAAREATEWTGTRRPYRRRRRSAARGTARVDPRRSGPRPAAIVVARQQHKEVADP